MAITPDRALFGSPPAVGHEPDKALLRDLLDQMIRETDALRGVLQAQVEVFADTAAGLAATVEGEQFWVESDDPDVAVYVYRHDAGPEATLIVEWPTVSGLSAKADIEHTHSIVQVTDVTVPGMTLVTAEDAAAQRAALGLGSAAQADATDFATAEQGTLADSAVQPDVLAGESAARALGDALTGALQRPGELPGAYRSSITGGPLSGTEYSATDVVIDAELGASIEIGSPTHVSPRAATPIEPGRVYLAQWRLRREQDPADPLGDGVEIGVRWLTETLTGVAGGSGNRVVETLTPVAAEPASQRSATFALDVEGVDFTIPAAARFAVPWVRTYGVDHLTRVARVSLIDITEAWIAQQTAEGAVTPPDIADLVEKVSGIEDGATANAPDAELRNRATHTGTQPIETVSDLQSALDAKAPLASPAFTGTPTGITKAHVGLDNVDNTSDANKPISTATQTALDAEAAARLAAVLLAQLRMEARAGGVDPRDGLLGAVLLGLAAADGSAAGLDGAGRGHLTGLSFYDPAGDPRDRISPYEVAIETLTGMLMGFLPGGRLHVSGLRLDVPGDSGTGDPRDRIARYIPIVTATTEGEEFLLLGLDSDGRLIVPGVSENALPTLRGLPDAVDVRVIETGQLIGAIATREGLDCTVIQRTDLTTYSTAVALDRIETMVCIGQSNAGAGSGPAGPPPIVTADRPHHVLKANGAYGIYGTSDATATLDSREDLTPYADPTNFGQSPMGLMLLALADMEAREGRRMIPRAGFTSWEGSQPIASFFPGASGHWNHENAIAGMQALKRVSAAYRGSRMGAVLFIQGENSSTDYDLALTDYIEDVLPLFGEALEQETPHFLFRQINTATAAESIGPNEVPLKQLQVARAKVGQGVTLTGPMYQAPLHDNIHSDNLGRMINAEADAVAWAAVRQGIRWHPLWPVAGAVTRSGVTVTIPFELPPFAIGLRFDTDWVQSVAAQGFAYADDAATGISVTDAAIAGDSVILTLSADPGSATGQRIDYALYNGPDDAGWASGRGHLYAESGLGSPFAARGFAVPPTIRHYCTRFRETIN